MVFDQAANEFVPDSTFADLDSEIVDEEVYRFLQCESGDIWFRNNRMKESLRENGDGKIGTDHYRNIAVDQGRGEVMSCSRDGSVWFGGTQKPLSAYRH